jgi:hypothetical protein
MNSDESLQQFLKDYPVLSRWKNDVTCRMHPKIMRAQRLKEKSFSVKDYKNLISFPDQRFNCKKKILFAHFSPFSYELEGLGLPLYASMTLPESVIDFTYDKGDSSPPCFNIQNDLIVRKETLENEYDLIVARSSVLQNMMNRSYHGECLKNSAYKVNIKTMSLASNYVYADHYFDEDEMCPPPDPMYLAASNEFLMTNKKENLICVSGTLWYVKNQLKMFQQLDPTVVKDFKIVILGPLRDQHYVNQVIKACEEKKLGYYLIGSVCAELAAEIKSLSKISLIPMDMRAFGQPKGYPRTLGESIGSKCLTLCNAPVTIPSFYKKTCKVYDESISGDLNVKLAECIELVNQPSFLKNHNWGESTFEDECKKTLLTCIRLGGFG